MSSSKFTRLREEAEREEDALADFIYPAKKGCKQVPLLKILLTNLCQGECKYCINNRRSNCPRFYIDPFRLGKHFLSLYKKNIVKGLFVSNAICKNPNFSQGKILETLIVLRKKFNYSDYIHAKVLPGADLSLIRELFNYADRLSINLEFPAQKYLTQVSTKVFFDDLIRRLKYLSKVNTHKKLKYGITTQFIVGATPATDREYLNFSYQLYRDFNLTRVYYSGFHPIKGTPLEDYPPVNPLRVKRLYEADYLIRGYKFSPAQFWYDTNGNLFLDKDVKEAFALKYKDFFPINVNRASWEELIKVPGIGKHRASLILYLRKQAHINSFDKLKKIGIPEKSKVWLCF